MVSPHFPDERDRLFISSEDCKDTVAWLKPPVPDFIKYTEGYRLANKILYKHCINNSEANVLVYPFIYNARHFIELSLKELIKKGYELQKENKNFDTVHNLRELWDTYKADILPIIGKDENIDKTIKNVTGIIMDFHQEDSKSYVYRYPNKNMGRKFLDLANFCNVMKKLANFFDWQWDLLNSTYTKF